jgi:hypothetical protein
MKLTKHERFHMPKLSQCWECQDQKKNCSQKLDFSKMPVFAENDLVIVVICSDFKIVKQ